MRNPFSTEASAFRFLLLTSIAFALVVGAAVAGGTVPGLVAWIVVTVAAAAFYVRRGGGRPTN